MTNNFNFHSWEIVGRSFWQSCSKPIEGSKSNFKSLWQIQVSWRFIYCMGFCMYLMVLFSFKFSNLAQQFGYMSFQIQQDHGVNILWLLVATNVEVCEGVCWIMWCLCTCKKSLPLATWVPLVVPYPSIAMDFHHYYKMWVQFANPYSLDQWIHFFFTSPCSPQPMNSFKIQWNHLAYRDTFCCSAFPWTSSWSPTF
jgi:hypothetical protein